MRITSFDATKYLYSPEAIVQYLEEAVDSHDAAYLEKATLTAIRAIKVLRRRDFAFDPTEVGKHDIR